INNKSLLFFTDRGLAVWTISFILLYNWSKRIPFAVVLYVIIPCSYSIKSSSTKDSKYSFMYSYDKTALYIIVVLVAPPPLAASKIASIISDLLLCFICFIAFIFMVYIKGVLEHIS